MLEDKKMPLTGHLEELRSRLIKITICIVAASILCYIFRFQILEFIQAPIKKTMKDEPLRYFSLMEPFLVHIKVSIYAGIFFSIPVILYQMWMFVAPGLLEKERKYVMPFITMGSIFFLLGAALCYFVILPYGTEFFLSFDPSLKSTINIASYVSFYISMTLVFGLVFQLPLIMVVLSRIGVVTSRGLAEKRKIAIILIFIVAAILTPPDPVTQTCMAIPLIIMYELSIYLTRIFGKKAPPAETAAPDQQA